MNTSNTYTPDYVTQALGVLENYIKSVLSEASDNQVDNTVSAQLKEITKTIERLDRKKVPIPESLLTEKLKLLSLVSKSSTDSKIILDIFERVSTILLTLEPCLLSISNINRSKIRKKLNTNFKGRKLTNEVKINNLVETSEEIDADSLSDYRFVKVKGVFVIDRWFQTSNWRDVKRNVYNCLIEAKPHIELDGILSFSKEENSYRSAVKLDKGFYTEGNLSASEIVRQCCQCIKLAGFQPLANYFKFNIIRRR